MRYKLRQRVRKRQGSTQNRSDRNIIEYLLTLKTDRESNVLRNKDVIDRYIKNHPKTSDATLIKKALKIAEKQSSRRLELKTESSNVNKKILLSLGIPQDVVNNIISDGFYFASKKEALRSFQMLRGYLNADQKRMFITEMLQENTHEYMESARNDIREFTRLLFGDLSPEEIKRRTIRFFNIPRWFDVSITKAHIKPSSNTHIRAYARVLYVGLKSQDNRNKNHTK